MASDDFYCNLLKKFPSLKFVGKPLSPEDRKAVKIGEVRNRCVVNLSEAFDRHFDPELKVIGKRIDAAVRASK